MRVQFNRHRKYGKDAKAGITQPDGLNCTPGVHDLPDEMKNSKFFQAHLKAGDCSVVLAPVKADETDPADDGKGKPHGKQK